MNPINHHPQRLLVTGGAGFIGANFAHYWLHHHPEQRVVVLDALTYAGNRSSLDGISDHPGFRFVHGDINHADLVEEVMREERIDTLVHFAAESHVDRSILGPDAFLQTNILGTHSLLKVARRLWLEQRITEHHRFHHVSTDEVYGSLTADDPPFSETTAYAPNSPYSASKAASDHLVRAYHHTYGLQVTTSNCSNNYGPYQFPEKLIPLVLLNILYAKPLPIYGDGSNIRDWLYVDDHVRGIERCIYRGSSGEVYNIGGENEWNNRDIVHLLCDELTALFAAEPTLAERFPDSPARSGEARELIRYVKDRPGHDQRYAIDARKSREVLGYAPAESFASGLRRTIRWYLDHEVWWQAVMDGSYQQWMATQYGVAASS